MNKVERKLTFFHLKMETVSPAFMFTNLNLLICRKQCVQTFNVFDFLRETVKKVPDLGGSDTAGEKRSVAKRRFGSVILYLLVS